MDYKQIKIIKHIGKLLKNKEKTKKEFDSANNKIFFSYVVTGFFSFFFLINLNIDIPVFFTILFSVLMSCLFISLSVIFNSVFDFHNHMVSKKLKKYNLYREKGFYEDFDSFLHTITIDFLNGSDQKYIKIYLDDIYNIINNIENEKYKNEIKTILIKKLEIDIDSIILDKKIIEENVIDIKQDLKINALS